MRKFFTILWLVWAGLWFIVVFLLIYIPLLFLFISPKTYKYAHYLRRFWGTTCCYLGFIIPKVIYESPLPKNQQFVFCANHISYIDIVCCGSLLPGFNFFMGKAELAEIPLFGIWFRTLDIAVKRSSIKGSYRAYVEAGEQMDRLGANLIIYPEGRIPQDAPNIKFPFKAGAFRLAIEKQVPIVPITLPDNLARFDLDNFRGSPGKMRMFVHTPIETKGLSLEDIPALQQKVYDVISSQLKSVGVL